MVQTWDYTIRIYKGRSLLVETVHRGEASRDIEIAATMERLRRGEVSHFEVLDHAACMTTTHYA
jgi:hypothetical protein